MMSTKQKEKTAVMPGHFVMRDRQLLASSRTGQEIGIVLSNDYYVDIDSLLTTPISHEEAKQYGKQLKLSLPSRKMLNLLADNQDIVNDSLLAAGRGDCLILGDVAKSFWTSRNNHTDNGKRKVVFIRPVQCSDK